MKLLSLTPLAIAIRYASLAAVAGTSLTVSAAATVSTAEKAHHYTIPASGLSVALNRFAQKASVSIVMNEAQLKSLNTQGLQGRYSISQGFAKLLKGSGFQAKKIAAGYTINKASQDDHNVAGTLSLTTVGNEGSFGDAPAEEGGFKAQYQTTATKMAMSLKETPQAISVVTRDSLDARQVMDLATAVELTAGTSNSGDGGGSFPGPGAFAGRGQHEQKFVLRGQPSDVRTDGFRTTGIYGSSSGVDMAVFERVEVVKGPAGFYGQGSLGGFINQVRKKPQAEFAASVSAHIGSFDSYRTQGDITGALTDDENIRGQLTMLYDNSGAFVGDLESERFLLAPSVEFIVNENTQVLMQFLYQKDQFDSYPGVPMNLVGNELELYDGLSSRTTLYGKTGDKSTVEIAEANVTVKHQLSDQWLASLLLQSAKRQQNVVQGNSGSVYDGFLYNSSDRDDWNRESWAGELRLEGSFEAFGFEHQALIGLEKNAQNRQRENAASYTYIGDPNTFDGDFSDYRFIPAEEMPTAFDKDEKIENQAVYAQVMLSVYERTKLLLGARYDDNYQRVIASYPTGLGTAYRDEKNNKKLTYRVGLTQIVNDNISAYGIYATSFLPTMSAGKDEILDPQIGDGFELGLKTDWFDDKLAVTLAAYRQELDNRPITDPESRTDDLQGTYSMSAGLHRTDGLELEVTGSPFPGLTLAGAASWMDNEFTEEGDNQGLSIDGSVDQQFSLYANYEWQQGPLTGFSLGATLVRVGDRKFLSTNAQFETVQANIDGYQRVDLNVSYTGIKNWNMNLLVRNVTDENYIDAANGNLYTGYYFGSPRAAMFKVTYNFE